MRTFKVLTVPLVVGATGLLVDTEAEERTRHQLNRRPD
jgi:hypothetical protein